jgi:hypothetical protein
MPLGWPGPAAGVLPPPCGFRLETTLVPLDEFLRDYDVNEVHSTRVAAPPERVLAAVHDVTSREVPLLVVLMALRTLPAVVLRRRPFRLRRDLRRPILAQATRGGFVVLAERPDELVLGVVGRFWTSTGGVERIDAADFAAFEAPGFAKAVMNFHVRPVDGGTVLTTETRIKGTDDEARRRFRRYWRVVMPGSAVIRRAWLRAIRRRAERGG